MIDLHTHSILSDGELVPSELARRAQVKGYRIIGISDHADSSNLASIIASLLKVRDKMEYYRNITILPGIEITHVPKNLIGELISEARRLGAMYVVVHGETLAEPVEEGTNHEAILAGADILAHPGLITEDDARLAAERKGPPRDQRTEGPLPGERPCGQARASMRGLPHLQHRFPRPIRSHVRGGGKEDRDGGRAFGG